MDFVKRVDLADPLQGEWAALAVATRDSADVSNDDLRMMLLRSLWTALWNPILDGSFWISRLRNILSSCILHSNGASTVAPFNTPLSFDEIAGNRKVIAGLEQRLAKNNHRTALIIHGPEGVGKAYVARIYGKIFLCPNRGKGLRACGDPMCSSCPEFDAGGGFGFIDFDCAADDPDARALRLRERLNMGPWSDRRFVLIRNLDHSPTVIGPLLKVLERASDVTTFVFCVNDIRTVSDAGKSRCWIYRLSELDRGDASVLAQALLRYMAIPNLAPESFESLLTFGRGSPQRLQDGCDRIAGLNDRSISGVAAALGFAGLPWGIAYWQKICDPTSSFAEVMELPAGGTPIDAIELIQNLLMLLRDCNSGLELAAPFDRSRGHLSDLLACFRQRAAKTHMSFEQLWSAVADIWTSAAPQISDEFAFRTRLTRKKIVAERDSI